MKLLQLFHKKSRAEMGRSLLGELSYHEYKPEQVLALIHAGAELEMMDTFGYTPLMLAASYGHEATVRALIKAGANVHHKNKRGNTVLMSAAGYGPCVQAIVDAGADINEMGEDGVTALSQAEFRGYAQTVRVLKETAERRASEAVQAAEEEKKRFLEDTDCAKGLPKPIKVPKLLRFRR